jgi:hypothetical protein
MVPLSVMVLDELINNKFAEPEVENVSYLYCTEPIGPAGGIFV